MLVIRKAACKDAPRQAMESSIQGLKSSTLSQKGRPSLGSHSILPVTAVLKGGLRVDGGGTGSCGKEFIIHHRRYSGLVYHFGGFSRPLFFSEIVCNQGISVGLKKSP